MEQLGGGQDRLGIVCFDRRAIVGGGDGMELLVTDTTKAGEMLLGSLKWI